MKQVLKTVLIGTMMSLVAMVVNAEPEPEHVIKYRKGEMQAMGGHMAAVAQIVKGNVEFGDRLAGHARALRSLTRDLAAVFPEGSDFGETRAKEEIWDEWEKFKKAARRAEQAGKGLAAAADGGDAGAIGKAFAKLGKSCKGCHDDFRSKKKN